MLDKLTFSLCPACYEKIPGLVTKTQAGVYITKECKIHGAFQDMVERDIKWYDFCKMLGSDKIYDGYFIDVTSKCNLKCQYCFYPTNGDNKDSAEIIKDATEHKDLTPFLLTGGEPTMHFELVEIVRQLSSIGETWVLSNGVALCDEEYLDELCSAGLLHGDTLFVGLSLHSESQGMDIELLNILRRKELKIGSVQIVIDRLDTIDNALGLYAEYKDVITVMKIKAASNLWSEQCVSNRLYVSDMLNYLRERGDLIVVPNLPQKVSYANVFFDGMFLNLVSWYEVGNVDLQDIDCAPFYKDKEGVVRDFVSACLKNEGLDTVQDGICVRRAVAADVNAISYLWEKFILEEDSSNTPNRFAWEEQSMQFIKNKSHYLLIAEKDGKVIGFQSGDVVHEPSIDKICVMGRHFYILPEYRKTSVATRLNKLTLQLGLRAGVTDIIRPITPRLLDFWQEKGCKVMNILIRTGYVGG